MAKVWGRIVVLVLLIIILLAGAAVWFDYLGVFDIKTTLAWVYRIPFVERVLGVQARSQEPLSPDAFLNLDEERYRARLEALDARLAQSANQEAANTTRQAELEQMAAELEERQRMLDEQEQSFQTRLAEAGSYDLNVEGLARNLNSIAPADAVGILNVTDDQLAIDIIRKVEEIAQAAGTASIVSFWFSLMDPVRAAELQRKMVLNP
ncbi:MAG: flagellar protein FlbB [Spirochaetaceae bacterium]|jgi:flagellar protein FlbB|nr:flagellar protein FlbB [Spirochaetaceae bacterium]